MEFGGLENLLKGLIFKISDTSEDKSNLEPNHISKKDLKKLLRMTGGLIVE
jgi:hypothetical protein